MHANAWVALLVCALSLQGCEGMAPQPSAPEAAREDATIAMPISIHAGAVELHHTVRGEGEPVVLIHGSLADLSYWEQAAQVAPLAEHYRVHAYSRRYNHPNRNRPGANHSAHVEAADLAALLDALGLDAVHLVGHSYGAYTALLFALEHPQRVRSLVLAEPPILPWLAGIEGGEGIEEGFMDGVWHPLAAAFREHGDDGGLEFTARWYFDVAFADMTPQWQVLFRNNVAEWRALALSNTPFPDIARDRMRALAVPVLLLSAGKNAGGFNDLIDGHIQALVPGAERVIIPDATHEMFLDAPELTASTMLEFFRRH